MYLVDASAWVTLVERGSAYRDAVASLIRAREHALAVLDLTLYEVGNAVGVKQGNAEEARRIVRLIHGCCRDRILTVDQELLDSCLGLAVEHGLTAYDAAYVAASRRTGSQLVSVDVRDFVSKGLAITPDAAV